MKKDALKVKVSFMEQIILLITSSNNFFLFASRSRKPIAISMSIGKKANFATLSYMLVAKYFPFIK